MTTRVNRRRMLTGEVISDKMNKTRVVRIKTTAKHHKYLKTVRRTVKFKAHDEQNASKSGDIVRIMETRPLSKDKRWLIAEVVKKS